MVHPQYKVNDLAQPTAGSPNAGKNAVQAPQQHAAIAQLVAFVPQIAIAFAV